MEYWQQFLNFTQLSYFPQILNILNIVLILITALVTWLSWRAARRANEIQLLPLMAIYFRGRAMHDRTIRIRNIGKSPAYDIKIESFVNIVTDIHKIWRLDLTLVGTNVIVPEEEKDLVLKATSNGQDADMAEFMVFHLDPEEDHPRKQIGLLMTFRNAEGKRYYSMVRTGPGGLYVNPARRFNVWGKLFVKRYMLWDVILISFYKLLWKFTKPHIAGTWGN